MGEEIATSHFSQEDFRESRRRLEQETVVLSQWFEQRRFQHDLMIGGFEVEAWLIDGNGVPAPENGDFLAKLNSPLVVPELAVFNVEINTPPVTLEGDALGRMRRNLEQTWSRCQRVARSMALELLMIGILPTIRDRDLTVKHMSRLERYRALNEQVLRLRRNKPIKLDIQGNEHLQTTHRDVMLEAAATSFQIHLQIPQSQSVRDYNAALVLSAPMVALTANSPFLFGRDLWDETRIPLFEQAVAVSATTHSKRNRVSFGHGYVTHSLIECFQENLDSFDILLPELMDQPPEQLAHLRLHNGTIWRWNRPLVAIAKDGSVSLRVEHRVVPAGPSLIDTIANAAFFFGLIRMLASARTPPESRLPFDKARENLYAAAKSGLRANLTWLDGNKIRAQELLSEILLPLARQGMEKLALDSDDIKIYLDVIEGRLQTGQNGASWQRAFVAGHGRDMKQLTCAYRENMERGQPVHEWKI
jgi:gamma-glutamyl:cysteine ligase YbdK (ATP-grasp superfamily)